MISLSDFVRVAKAQSALDIGCHIEDFDMTVPVLVPIRERRGQKRYFSSDDVLLTSYGNNVVGCVPEEVLPSVAELVSSEPFYRAFELPVIEKLNRIFAPFHLQCAFLAEMYLPDPARLKPLPCPYEIRVLDNHGIAPFYLPEWDNALTASDPAKDKIGVGAFDNGKLIGLAACSADCETMWQIGVDVLPEYRQRGIASALVSRLAPEIIKMGKVPFYSVAWSNLPSKRVALSCGFVPSWVELSAIPL